MDDWSIGWYCVRSKPRMENVAAATLSSLEQVEVFLPRTQRKNLKIKQPIKPLFPGYFSPVLTQLNTYETFIMPEVWPI